MAVECRPVRKGWLGLLGGDPRPAPVEAVSAPSLVDQLAEMQRCLYDLAGEVRRLTVRAELGQLCDEEPQLRSLYRQMLDQEVEREVALTVVQGVSGELSRQAVGDYRIVRERALARMAQLLPCRGPVRLRPGEGKVLFLVGPTGVGKTTTLAKLAAQIAVYEKRQVLLATADNYRIGAQAQLQTYADIMGLPLVTVRSAEEMAEVADRYQAADLILVDTPGRSQRNGEGIAEAQAFVKAVPPARREVHLAIAASTRLHELEDVVGAFAPVGIDALVATKLDEALHFGPLVSLVSRCGRPLSYVTTGQSVPEDLEAASASLLAELVLRGY